MNKRYFTIVRIALLLALLAVPSHAQDTNKTAAPPYFRPITDRSGSLVGAVKELTRDRKFEWRWAKDTTGELPESSQKFLELLQTQYKNKRAELERDLKTDLNEAMAASNKELRRNYDMDRHDLLKKFLAEAVQMANAELGKQKNALIKELLVANSGSSGDVTRDIDATLITEDSVQEAALFDALKKVVKNHDLTIVEDGHAPPTIKELEVSFHRGSLEPPTFTKYKDVRSFALNYEQVLTTQLKNPEAYIGWGFDIEVKGRMTQTFKPGVTRVQRFIADANNNVAYRGDIATSQREARALLDEPYERTYTRGMRVMRMLCNLLQSTHHVKPGEAPDPTKGPPKYAGRSLEDLAAVYAEDFGGKAYEKMSDGERRQLLERILGHGAQDPTTPQGKQLLEFKETLDRLGQLTDKNRRLPVTDAAGKPVELAVETARTLEFMKRCLASQVSLMAKAMLNPPYDPEFRKVMAQQEGWNCLDTATHDQLALAAETKYRQALSAEAMINLLTTMWSVRELSIPGFQAEGKPFGAELTDMILQEQPWNKEVRHILERAAEYGEAKALFESSKDIAVRNAQTERMRRCMDELQGLVDDSHAKTAIEEWAKTPPEKAILAGPEQKALWDSFREDWKTTKKIYADRVAKMFDQADWEAFQKARTSELAMSGGKQLRNWAWDETLSLPTVLDVMNVLELYQRDAPASEIAGAVFISAVSRAHWSLGYLIGGWSAIQSGDEWVVAEFAGKSGLWTVSMFVPELAPVLVTYEVLQGAYRMIIVPRFDKLDALNVESCYTGQYNAHKDAQFVLTPEFLSTVQDKKSNTVVVVNHLKLFNDRFAQWAGVDFTDRRFPKKTNYVSRLMLACDDYVKLIEAEMAAKEPVWITPTPPSATDLTDTATKIASGTSQLLNEQAVQKWDIEQIKERINNRRLDIAAFIRPHIEEECRLAMPDRRTIPTEEYRQKLLEGMIQRFINDFIIGLDHAALNRLATQVLAKQQVQRMIDMGRLRAMAEALQKRLLHDDTPLPVVTLKAGYNLTDPKAELDGTDPIPLLCEVETLGAVPVKMTDIELRLEYKDVIPVDSSKTKLEPGDLVRHKVDVVAMLDGRELARQTVNLLVRLPGLTKGAWVLTRQWSDAPEQNKTDGNGLTAMIMQGRVKVTGATATSESNYIVGPMHQKMVTSFRHTWTEPPGKLRPSFTNADGKAEAGDTLQMTLTAEDNGSTKFRRTDEFLRTGKGNEWEPAPAMMQGGQTGQTSVRWSLVRRKPNGDLGDTLKNLPVGGDEPKEAKAISKRKSPASAKVTFQPPAVLTSAPSLNQSEPLKPEEQYLVGEVKVSTGGAGASVYYAYTWSKTGVSTPLRPKSP